jgi:hypothetical protein
MRASLLSSPSKLSITAFSMIERMTSIVGQHGKESQRGPAIAFPERVNHIQL